MYWGIPFYSGEIAGRAEKGFWVITSVLPQGNSNLLSHIYWPLMVTEPKEMVASNCPWPFVKNNEIIDYYSHEPRKTHSK